MPLLIDRDSIRLTPGAERTKAGNDHQLRAGNLGPQIDPQDIDYLEIERGTSSTTIRSATPMFSCPSPSATSLSASLTCRSARARRRLGYTGAPNPRSRAHAENPASQR
ncbi:MAG TPA: hypothetical protein VMT66_02445 [Steroidobacteraceae bacterium]|nr:hypothetical protein [Steroidobacteraceae bacterium]